MLNLICFFSFFSLKYNGIRHTHILSVSLVIVLYRFKRNEQFLLLFYKHLFSLIYLKHRTQSCELSWGFRIHTISIFFSLCFSFYFISAFHSTRHVVGDSHVSWKLWVPLVVSHNEVEKWKWNSNVNLWCKGELGLSIAMFPQCGWWYKSSANALSMFMCTLHFLSYISLYFKLSYSFY